MFRAIVTFGLMLLAVPIMGLLFAQDLAHEGVKYFNTQTADAAREMCAVRTSNSADAIFACEFLSSARDVEMGLIATVLVMTILIISYMAAAFTLARPRDRLARWFPRVIRVSLVTTVAVFATQGALLIWTFWERLNAGHTGGATILILVGAGLIVSAAMIAWSWRQLLSVKPLEVTGVLSDRERFPELWSRVERLAIQLEAKAPKQIILGLEPTAFVTTTVINLRNSGLLAPLETLYLPICGIRLWTDAELDAVIGHELGHFRGEDLRYSERFAPAARSLGVSLQSVDIGSDENVGLFRAARLPAALLLSAMLGLFARLITKISRERELVADAAAVSVSSGTALIGALGKISILSAEWPQFWSAMAHYVTFGCTRINFCQDFTRRVALRCGYIPPADLTRLLLASRQVHPLDSHPLLADRAAALNIDASAVLEESIAEIMSRREVSPNWQDAEEEITRVITEHIAIPGRRLQIDLNPTLPSKLAI